MSHRPLVTVETLDGLDKEKLKDQAADVVAILADAGTRAQERAAHLAGHAKVAAGQAKLAAGHAKDWGSPKVGAFMEWLTPRVEKAWAESANFAAPKVERAAELATPAIDTAHDKLVDEFLPRVVASFNAAAVAAAADGDSEVLGLADAAEDVDLSEAVEKISRRAARKADRAARKAARKAADITEVKDVINAKLDEMADDVASGKKRHGKALWWVLFGATASGIGYYLWRRAQPKTDPWAEPWEQEAPGFDDVVDDARNAVGDAAEAMGEAAGIAVAKGREATDNLAERVQEVREDITGRVTDAVDQAKEQAKKAADKARRTKKDDGDETTAQESTGV